MSGASPWDAERVVDVARAQELVGRAVPDLIGEPVQHLSAGWDHTVHVVGDRWVVRFPRRAVALPGFRRELAVLPRLAPLLPQPVPVPVWTGTDEHPTDPWPFAVTRRIPGEELAAARPAEAARGAVAAALGGFLRALHSPSTAAAAGDQLPEDPMRRATPAAWAENTRGQLALLAGAGAEFPAREIDGLLADGAHLGPPSGRPVLAHGDLHVRHVLVGGGAVTGVIDWGDVCLADPAVDLSIAYAGFGGRARGELFAAYGPVDDDQVVRARCLAVRLSAFLARYAAAEGHDALLAESLLGLHRAVG